MQFEIETVKLKKLLEIGMLVKSSPLSSKTVITFTENGAKISETYSFCGIYALFSKNYFSQYNIERETDIAFTETLYQRLKNGFTSDNVTVSVDDKDIIVKGEKEYYREPISAIDHNKLDIPLVKSDYGLIPELNFLVQVKTSAEQLKYLPDSDIYDVFSDGDRLAVRITDFGEYIKNLDLLEVKKLGEYQGFFDVDFLKRMVGNLDGEIWLHFKNDSKGHGLVITQVNTDFAITFLLAGVEQ